MYTQTRCKTLRLGDLKETKRSPHKLMQMSLPLTSLASWDFSLEPTSLERQSSGGFLTVFLRNLMTDWIWSRSKIGLLLYLKNRPNAESFPIVLVFVDVSSLFLFHTIQIKVINFLKKENHKFVS